MSESHSAWEAEIAALKARVEELEAESRGLRAHVTPDPDDVEYYMTDEEGSYCEYCNTYMCDDCDEMAYEQGEEDSGWGPSLHCCPKHAPK